MGHTQGGEECQQSAGKSRNEDINPGHVFLRSGFAQRLQFTDDRFPEVRLVRHIDFRRPVRTADGSHGSRAGDSLLLCRLLFGFRFSRSGSSFFCSPFCLTGELERHLCGRQTIFIVASTIFQIPFQLIGTTRQFQLLHKLSRIFKIAHLHFEQLVESRDFLAYGLQFTNHFRSGYFLHIESRRDRTAIVQVSGIDMPALVNSSRKNDLRFISSHSLQFGLELDGILYLCPHRHREKQQK